MPDLRTQRRAPLLATSPGVRPLPPQARWLLRGGPRVRIAAETALKVALPAAACRATMGGESAALWLGPDEWLLICEEPASQETAAALRATLAGLPHSLVDVSHRQIALEVSGRDAPALLAAGCPLDLEASAFPVGMCTRTMLAKAEIVLWRTAPEVFRIEVWRSFAPYVSAFLSEAACGVS
ncbi:MAG TPA: sarcosine oxidase subunit gamma family protein [Steroidobacteraceae bacterium]|nr:sarcosine oxidase subunit gamma family protein [Steroidobacteraceae bacterium]